MQFADSNSVHSHKPIFPTHRARIRFRRSDSTLTRDEPVYPAQFNSGLNVASAKVIIFIAESFQAAAPLFHVACKVAIIMNYTNEVSLCVVFIAIMAAIYLAPGEKLDGLRTSFLDGDVASR